MSDIKIDSNGQAVIVNGDLVLTTGVEAIAQDCSRRLRTFFSEWFLDLRRGVPWFEHILIKNPDPVIVDIALKKEIVNTPGIIELLRFDVDFDNAARNLSLDFKASTTDGVLDFSEEVPGV